MRTLKTTKKLTFFTLLAAVFMLVAACQSAPAAPEQVTIEIEATGIDFHVKGFKERDGLSSFRVASGQEVTVVLISRDAFHTFTIPKLSISMQAFGGETVAHTFTAPEKGMYEYQCIPHAPIGMLGIMYVDAA